jgi:hypothetical protein
MYTAGWTRRKALSEFPNTKPQGNVPPLASKSPNLLAVRHRLGVVRTMTIQTGRIQSGLKRRAFTERIRPKF